MTTSSIFFNHTFDKKRLKSLISWVFKRSGEEEALRIIEILKETGFRYATQAGISIGLHDLTTPKEKQSLISEAQIAQNLSSQDFIGARITATERGQRIIDTWHRASESLRKQVVDHFTLYDPFNPVYIMALSGARGNFSQVRQLIGMRGLMADQQGKIVSFPIKSNLREGLTLTEYFISCSGARKGLVDTALRTADTGYLTRRLVDVSHHVVVKSVKCNTNRFVSINALQSYNKLLLGLKERLVGRVLAEDIELSIQAPVRKAQPRLPFGKEAHVCGCKPFSIRPSIRIAQKNQEIYPELASQIAAVRKDVLIRSPLTCAFTNSVCQLCYGWSMSQGRLVPLGDAVGVIAAQSIGEPGTQLTMRTFHTGGVFSGDLLQDIRAPHAGKIQFSNAFQGLLVRTAHGEIAFLSKVPGELILTLNSPLSHLESNCSINNSSRSTKIPIQAFTMLFVRQGQEVEKNQLLAEFSTQRTEGNQPIKTQQTLFAELSGRIIEDRGGKSYVKKIKEVANFPSQNSPNIYKPELLTFPLIKENVTQEKVITKSTNNLQKSFLPFFSFGRQKQLRRKLFYSDPNTNASSHPVYVHEYEYARGDYTESFTRLPTRVRTPFDPSNGVRTRDGSEAHVCGNSSEPRVQALHSGMEARQSKSAIHGYENVRYTEKFVLDLFTGSEDDSLTSSLKYIEPIKSGRLGFLKILATRVGARLDYVNPVTSLSKLGNFRPYTKAVGVSTGGKVTKDIPRGGYPSPRRAFRESVCASVARSARREVASSPTLVSDTLQIIKKQRYSHTEQNKDKHFYLQTIAEYGDIVNDTYKKLYPTDKKLDPTESNNGVE